MSCFPLLLPSGLLYSNIWEVGKKSLLKKKKTTHNSSLIICVCDISLGQGLSFPEIKGELTQMKTSLPWSSWDIFSLTQPLRTKFHATTSHLHTQIESLLMSPGKHSIPPAENKTKQKAAKHSKFWTSGWVPYSSMTCECGNNKHVSWCEGYTDCPPGSTSVSTSINVPVSSFD